jgi:zinc/manganese transport system substrate-binding protein
MRNTAMFLIAAALTGLALPVSAALNVLACEPEWGALTRELGGDKVNVYEATGPLQDPHRIEPKPSLIARARGADLVVCTGAELEEGWLPVVLRESGNPKVQPGQPGYFDAARYVVLLDRPARLDRSMGDIHAAGDPHIQGDPRNMGAVAAALTQRLAEIDPANAGAYRDRGQAFQQKWSEALKRWEALGAPLKGVPVVMQHKNVYLLNWLGLKEVATLEPKPGMEPTTSHLGAVLAGLEKQPAKLIVRAAYSSERPSQWLAERAKIPVVVIPFTVGGSDQAKDLFALYDDTLNRLLQGAK